jgi:hypothetical protein
MADRLITLTLTGFTPAGFEIALQILDVKAADLATAIAWFDAQALGHGLRPGDGQCHAVRIGHFTFSGFHGIMVPR